MSSGAKSGMTPVGRRAVRGPTGVGVGIGEGRGATHPLFHVKKEQNCRSPKYVSQ